MSSNEKFEREFEAFMNEEDSRLATLYRKLPQAEPDAKLDAAVRSMAHRALNPQLVATPRAQSQRRRARWLPAFGAAAGIVLAAGIAWRVEMDRRSERNEAGAPASDVITVRQLDVPPPAAEAPLSPAPPPADSATSAPSTSADGLKAQSAAPASGFAEPVKPASAAVEREKAAKLSEQTENQPAVAGGTMGKVENAAKSTPPQAFPAPAQKRSSEMDAVERKQIMAAGAWQNLHDRDTGKTKANAKAKSFDDKAPAAAAGSAGAPETRAALPASPAPAAVMKSVSAPSGSPSAPRPAESTPSSESTPSPAAQAESAPMLQAAPSRPQVTPQAPPMAGPARESAAPARADAADHAERDESMLGRAGKDAARARSTDPNAGLYPEHWLAHIRSMLKENHRDDALRSLAEFRRIYPDYKLPDDLHDLAKP
jgi:hypothetical protein